MTSLKETLVSYLTDKDWTSKGILTDQIKWYHKDKIRTFLAESVGRKLREAEEESLIAVKDDGVSVQYKYLPERYRSRYIPYSRREDKQVLFKQ